MALPNMNTLRVPREPDALGGDDGPPGAETLKAQITSNARRKTEEGAGDEDADPRLKREYAFDFRYVDGNNREYAGRFTNKILTMSQRLLAGSLTSDLVANRPMASLPGTAAQLAYAIGWMSFSLQEPRPTWAADLSLLDDEIVVLRLWKEVWGHQSTFLGRKDDAAPEAPKTE